MILGIISEGKMSDISTLCSNNINEKEEVKSAYTFNSINNKNNSSFFKIKDLLYIKNDSEKKIKKYNSTSKIIKNNQLSDIDIKQYLKIAISKKKNIADKKDDDIQINHIKKNKINIINISKPINNNILNHNKNENKKCIKRKKVEIVKKDFYTQNKDISCMNKNMPKIPDLFNHEFNLQNKNISNNYNKAFEQINKEIIPNSFYNHLMFSENNNNIINNKKKCFKTSLTERNKNKLLTIIYYSPKIKLNA